MWNQVDLKTHSTFISFFTWMFTSSFHLTSSINLFFTLIDNYLFVRNFEKEYILLYLVLLGDVDIKNVFNGQKNKQILVTQIKWKWNILLTDQKSILLGYSSWEVNILIPYTTRCRGEGIFCVNMKSLS